MREQGGQGDKGGDQCLKGREGRRGKGKEGKGNEEGKSVFDGGGLECEGRKEREKERRI